MLWHAYSQAYSMNPYLFMNTNADCAHTLLQCLNIPAAECKGPESRDTIHIDYKDKARPLCTLLWSRCSFVLCSMAILSAAGSILFLTALSQWQLSSCSRSTLSGGLTVAMVTWQSFFHSMVFAQLCPWWKCL